MSNNIKIGIIGAGIQGVCSALFLQKKGYQVTLFDRDEPGNAASYGNAGHFSPYASVSLNRTDILSDVPSMLISSRGPLALKWNYVHKMIPWFARFILNCGNIVGFIPNLSFTSRQNVASSDTFSLYLPISTILCLK